MIGKVRRVLRSGADSLGALMFPPVCHVCGELLAPDERFVCLHCLSTLPRTLYHRSRFNPMEQRLAGQLPFERATGWLFYTPDTDVARLVYDFKYHGYSGLGRELGKACGTELLPSGFFAGIDMVIPVPLHFLKEWKRGYNQSEMLAVGIGEATGIEVAGNLRAKRPHRSQTTREREDRWQNTSGIFAVSDPHSLKGKHVLIVDDICTTGATIISAGKALIEAQPDIRLSVLTLGVTF